MNINKVLVPVDFSPPSTLAVNCGVVLARKLRAKLSLLHVVESPSLLFRFPTEVEKVETQRKEQAERMLPALELFYEERRRVRQYVDEQFAKFRAEANLRKVRIECVIAEGEASETLMRIADENDVDFMILGLRKMGAMKRALLGSTAEPVIREAHVPVLSIPIDTTMDVEEPAR